MTQEEKAKAYDNLLIKLQKAKVDNNVCDERYCCVIDDIVPELKESEDEKIRKEIVRFIQMEVEDEIVGNKWLAWLEKQGEKGTNGNERKIPNSEQKPAWSDEDENIRQWITHDIDKLLALKKKSYIIADKEINWLKSLKGRIQLQNRWKPSEEQMEALLYEVNAWDKDSVNGQNLKSLYQELKKLREE